MTEHGYRYLSGVGGAFLQRLHVAVQLCLGSLTSLLLIADGARWIRTFFTETLATLADKTMILDWHHLRQSRFLAAPRSSAVPSGLGMWRIQLSRRARLLLRPS